MSKVVSRKKSKSFCTPGLSDEQMWAKVRNFNKFRLSGMKANFELMCNEMTLTPWEHGNLKGIIAVLEDVLKKWDGHNTTSKANYLRMIRHGKK